MLKRGVLWSGWGAWKRGSCPPDIPITLFKVSTPPPGFNLPKLFLYLENEVYFSFSEVLLCCNLLGRREQRKKGKSGKKNRRIKGKEITLPYQFDHDSKQLPCPCICISTCGVPSGYWCDWTTQWISGETHKSIMWRLNLTSLLGIFDKMNVISKQGLWLYVLNKNKICWVIACNKEFGSI